MILLDTRGRIFCDFASVLNITEKCFHFAGKCTWSSNFGPFCLLVSKTAKAQQGLRTFDLLMANLKLDCCLLQELTMVACWICRNRLLKIERKTDNTDCYSLANSTIHQEAWRSQGATCLWNGKRGGEERKSVRKR